MENVVQMAWPFILMGVIFYFMIYRPQKRDQKKRANMLDSLKVGTRIVTIGGNQYTAIVQSDLRQNGQDQGCPHPHQGRGRR